MPQWIFVAVVLAGRLLSSLNPGFAGPTIDSGRPPDSVRLISISITPSEQAVSVGAVASYQAIATFSDGTTADVTSMSTWTVSPAGGSQVVGPGSIHAQTAGSSMISAEWSEIRAAASLRIH